MNLLSVLKDKLFSESSRLGVPERVGLIEDADHNRQPLPEGRGANEPDVNHLKRRTLLFAVNDSAPHRTAIHQLPLQSEKWAIIPIGRKKTLGFLSQQSVDGVIADFEVDDPGALAVLNEIGKTYPSLLRFLRCAPPDKVPPEVLQIPPPSTVPRNWKPTNSMNS